MKEKMFIIPEDELVNLLTAKYEMNFLDANGVDNWTGYNEGRDEFMARALKRERPSLYQEYKNNGDDFYCYHSWDLAQDTLYEYCKKHDIKEMEDN